MPLLLPKSAKVAQALAAQVADPSSMYLGNGSRRTDAQRYAGRPIHLTATATVHSNAQSAVNSQALHNPVGGPMAITQIKFGMNFADIRGGFGISGNGATLGCSLDLNGEKITNGYVPIWSFGPCLNLLNEQMHGVNVPQGGEAQYTNYCEFAWDLSRPIWLGPDDQINASFQHFGQITADINARLSMSGSVVSWKPSKGHRYLPYAAYYASKVFNNNLFNAGVDSDSSTETDLVNTTDDVIYVERLTGRFNSFLYSKTVNSEGISLYGGSLPAGVENIPGQIMTVTMFTGHGFPIVPYQTKFRNVFPGATRSWELGGVPLKPGDYYLVNIFQNAPSAGGGQFYAQANVGLVGWRVIA